MSYVSSTIAKAVNNINRNYFLPAIQRPFVWEPEKIVALFDSILKGYPISSFLFWEISPENRKNWEIYKFVEEFKFGSTHNQLAEIDGREVTLVLDGQQRLTSMLIGLRGVYVVKLKNKRWDNPDAWVKQRLYIDLFKDPQVEGEDSDFGITYGLKFLTNPPRSDENHLWFKIGEILDYEDESKFADFKDSLIEAQSDKMTKGQANRARAILDTIHRRIWRDQVVSYYTETNQSYDRVLDIFIRANDGGTKLSKSDLLLSMITSKWNGINARDEIYGFVEQINDSDRKNNFDKDFIMRACLVLSDLDHVYKVENFTSENLSIIQKNWPSIKEAIYGTVRLINRFGIDRDSLTSTNALLPIAYYLYHVNNRSLDGTTQFEIDNAETIRRWLLGALLNNVFGGTSDQTIGLCRKIVSESLGHSRDFPAVQLSQELSERQNKAVLLDSSNIEALLDTKYTQKTRFLGVSTLYDGNFWGASRYHIDHIIPQALCSDKALKKLGISQDRMEVIKNCVDRLGNLQLLLDRENLEKSDKPLIEWLATRDKSFLNKHLIPNDPNLFCPERLPEFIAAREKMIRDKFADHSLEAAA
jgi:uncharacterized protein with ParB-like and HNH nuclease domain